MDETTQEIKVQHTPGPWLVRSTGAKGSRRVVAEEPNPSYAHGTAEVLVAEVYGAVGVTRNGEEPWSQPFGDAEADALKEANARLIAAAPELLAALKEIGDRLDAAHAHQCVGWDCAECGPMSASQLQALIGDAIAKAEG